MNRAQTLVVLVLAVTVVALVVPAAAGMAEGPTQRSSSATLDEDPNPDGGDEGTPWLAPGTGGKANQGREDNEKQQYPGNTSFRIDDHAPGATENSFNIFAVGFSENIRMHWNVVRQEDFRWDTCTSTDATAFGTDRGNDDPGTETDQSLLNAYQSVTYTKDGIYVEFFKKDSLAGSPVNITVNDQIVSRVTNCLQNPDEPGWYRLTGYVNGSTQMDATTDLTIYGAAKYVYVCEGCDTRQDAIDKLGPPPTTCPPTDEFGRDTKEWTCRSQDGEYYTRSDPPSGGGGDPTATGTATTTPPPGATPTPTSAPTPTATAADTPTATASPTPTDASQPAASTPTAPPEPTATGTAQQSGGDRSGGGDGGDSSGGGGGSTAATTAGGSGGSGSGGGGAGANAAGPRTPTAGAGPGLGVAAALAGLALAAFLAFRRD